MIFTWAIIDLNNNVLSIQRASLDVPKQDWVKIPDGTKWKQGLVYNPTTKDVE